MSTTKPFGDSLLFYLNGKRMVVEKPDLDFTLLSYLRSIGLTGTKLGCGEGGCGACTVMVSRYDLDQQRIVHTAVNACLCPLYTVDGKHVITVEGLGTTKKPHPCGFCTPGFVMSLNVLTATCAAARATGPILDAAKTFADQAWKRGAAVQNSDGTVTAVEGDKAGGCGIEGCCRLQKKPVTDSPEAGQADKFELPDPTNPHMQQPPVTRSGCCGGAGADGGCCKTGKRADSAVAGVDGSNEAENEKAAVIAKFQTYDPTQDLIFPPFLVRYAKGETKEDEPQLRALAIASSDSTAWCQRFYRPLTLAQLLEIRQEHPDSKLVAGNSEVGVEIKLKRAKFPVQVYVNDIAELRQVTCMDTGVQFGANLTLARFEVLLDALVAEHGSIKSQNFAALRENLRYFAGNQIRNVATIAGNIATASPISDLNPVFMAAGAVVTLVSAEGQRQVPLSEFFLGYRRTAMRASEVLLNVFVPFSQEGEITRAFKQAKRKDDDHCNCHVADAAFAYGGMAPTTVLAKGAMAAAVGGTWGERAVLDRILQACQAEMRLDYTTLTTSFLFKFWAIACAALQINTKEAAFAHEMEDSEREMCKGQQEYATGVTHMSALKQVTGEARYTDDIPARAHAKILSIDASRALAMPGVHRVLTHKDVPGSNVWNIFHDEEILPSEEVHYMGQPKLAQEAARSAVAVEYDDLPAVLSIRDAVAQDSLFPEVRQLINGDVEQAFRDADFVFEGESYCGAQEHFYLETFGCITVPKGEGDEFDIYSSTQNPTESQLVAAEALGVPANRIVCHTKRLGGGFGGKESRSVLLSTFTTLGAYHTNKSVRCILDRDEDMQTSGQRHPFLGKWRVGVNRDGKLVGLRAHIYSNGGFSHDLSMGVLERAVSHLDNCYWIPNNEIVGRVCKTNTQSNTAFRSFGGCQGMIILESMLCEVADKLAMPVERLREINMYKEGQLTPFRQPVVDWNVPLMWEQLKAKASYDERRREGRRLQRKFGISFGVKFLNQGYALVHMGQGLHTKMAQIAAETLETATNTAANTSPTAASASADLNGFAVYNACKELADRLRPWPTWIASTCRRPATMRLPDIGFDWEKNEGQFFFYFTQGVAAAEVELDTLTGAHTTRRVDILMDVGKSLNKALDIGQIEGAFAQGQGWSTTEEFLYFPSNGRLFTQGPGNYKIPSAMDIPRDFRVSLLEGVKYSALKTIFSSKGIGEPPLFLGASVFYALRDAVSAARKHSDVTETLHLESPATAEDLRLACEDELVQMARIPAAQKEGRVPGLHSGCIAEISA
ncbi:xanthine dehydrogenase [Linderina pennispora]|uniref:Xanthine dehydrogenase n=1 Tax=Linderina pennispora TaxID=61395 RepID=A0A1Y1VXW0_9FUNG|nr:xanthine dehydrogenase [Linderina pennispora]ORX66053.1 xanthine dehydrogenase [Linderina pennispora]